MCLIIIRWNFFFFPIKNWVWGHWHIFSLQKLYLSTLIWRLKTWYYCSKSRPTHLVYYGTFWTGIPAFIAACLAGPWATQVNTWPIITSSISSLENLIFLKPLYNYWSKMMWFHVLLNLVSAYGSSDCTYNNHFLIYWS